MRTSDVVAAFRLVDGLIEPYRFVPTPTLTVRKFWPLATPTVERGRGEAR